MVVPRMICPQPMRRQCFSTRRERAIFSLAMVHTGEMSEILAKSCLTAITRPPVEVEPMFTISTSPFTSFCTRLCCLSPSAFTPSSRRRRKKLISRSVKMSGSLLTSPST
eukprot:Mycagemm_TRINITY_DN10110_c0_g1::TRINITY_DN10110_c0_g1_i1::g.5029::m.5029 type:complete len:110 gc:universal TRINITY_DN10110_c0_g1_i1:2781-2452(-)